MVRTKLQIGITRENFYTDYRTEVSNFPPSSSRTNLVNGSGQNARCVTFVNTCAMCKTLGTNSVIHWLVQSIIQINFEVAHFQRNLEPHTMLLVSYPTAKVIWCSYVALSACVCIHTLAGRRLRHEQPFTIWTQTHMASELSVYCGKATAIFPYRSPWDPNHQDHYMKHEQHFELPS